MPKYLVYRKTGQVQELAATLTAADQETAARLVAADEQRGGKYVVVPATSATIFDVEVQHQYQATVTTE
jgi:hypothetical protein